WQPAPRRRRWVMAAAVLIVGVGAFSLAEATGVTKLVAIVLRIETPEGTLIVDVDDPNVKVAIEADGDVVFTGAGAPAIRLKPGHYLVKATKEGKPVEEKQVTIERGGKEVVRIRREPAPAPKPAAPELLHSFVGLPDTVWSLAFSPDGRHVLAGFY